MLDPNYNYTVVDRFLKYVKIDTQSDEEATSFPSAAKELDLAKILVEELKAIGMQDVELDEWGYVYATLPANTKKENVTPIAFIAHYDTSPAVSGANVNPIIHKNYQGGDIVLPNDTTKVIKVEEHPDLKNMIGCDIITTDGTTLLGADDKAGIAEIIDAMNYLIQHPEIEHGKIRVCFTPDEEVGRGTEHINVEKLGIKYAYTVDGSICGEIESETFSADAVVIEFKGKNIHPGYAKGKMINSIKIASEFISSLPKDTLSPETTEGKEGYVHATSINGNEELTTVKMIIRDFVDEKLVEYENMLKDLAQKAVDKYPGSSFTFTVKEQYRNMLNVLKHHPLVIDVAVEAMNRLGIKPIMSAIRGGTDGARLSFMGVPTPNLFAGGHAFHSYLEWVAIQDMQKAVNTIVEISKIYCEKA
ncbi:MAG TPA: peptidase T [Ignavibacteriales bacterium]|nr:peptidase T [Ignavibacteriales bacterium]HOL80890.1 peptidase T [Ignavibacteriales bacterium]HOM65914.1 peptidase T [Ignavibacteriales bacterium]HPD67974.1 peptidase T [Ignavibacteriales bacterium]HPP33325.1 peptidase T [Ignavibacteriales bacterium]